MNVEIAERLARKRRERGLSQEDLAEQLGVSRQAVSKWERSESSPDTDNLIALASLYGVSLDDLLYVDETIKDDVSYEAKDKSTYQPATQDAPDASQADNKDNDAPQAQASTDSNANAASQQSTPADGETTEKETADHVHVGVDGVHVVDGNDYVHVSWRDGVHVKNDKDGEVHVGWDGIHVNDKGHAGTSSATLVDDDGSTVTFNNDGGVVINGEHFDSMRDAHKAYNHGSGKMKDSALVRFPFPILVLIAYLLVGFLANEWVLGLFLIFTIPVYYIVAAGIAKREVMPIIAGVYPLLTIAWFLWMAFIQNQPHPAWVVFLTIPLVEWAAVSVSHWWRKRKRAKETQDNVIDVNPE